MTFDVVVFVNLFCALVGIWAAMYINNKFIRPTALNQLRFSLYELRDRVAILAMEGVVNEDSEEYVTLRDLMNATLKSTKDFKITSFIKMHFDIASDEALQDHVRSIVAKVENEEMPPEFREIVVEYFEINSKVYWRKTRPIRFALTPLIFVVRHASRAWKKLHGMLEYLQKQEEKVARIECYLKFSTAHSHA